jgi:hypothetical protein
MSEPHLGADDQVGGVLLPVVLPLLSSLVLLVLSWLPVTTPVLSSVLPWVFRVPVLRLGWFLQAHDLPSCQPHGRPGETSSSNAGQFQAKHSNDQTGFFFDGEMPSAPHRILQTLHAISDVTHALAS